MAPGVVPRECACEVAFPCLSSDTESADLYRSLNRASSRLVGWPGVPRGGPEGRNRVAKCRFNCIPCCKVNHFPGRAGAGQGWRVQPFGASLEVSSLEHGPGMTQAGLCISLYSTR